MLKAARGVKMTAPALGLVGELIPVWPKALVLVSVDADPVVFWFGELAVEVRAVPRIKVTQLCEAQLVYDNTIKEITFVQKFTWE